VSKISGGADLCVFDSLPVVQEIEKLAVLGFPLMVLRHGRRDPKQTAQQHAQNYPLSQLHELRLLVWKRVLSYTGVPSKREEK